MTEERQISYWFIRLGGSDHLPSRLLHEGFAKNYNLVKIGYGIEEDLTKLDRQGIKEYVRRESPHHSPQKIGSTTGLIDTFINHIKIGDRIISPFGRNPERLIMGEVVSECGTIESFFKGREKELQEFIAEHLDSDEQGFIEVKPAIKVKWQDEELNLDTHPQLRQELGKTMRRTVNGLKLDKIVNATNIDDSEKIDIKAFFEASLEAGVKIAKKEGASIARNVITSLIVAGILAVFGFIYKNYL